MTLTLESLRDRRTTRTTARYAASLTASACLAVTLVVTVGPPIDATLGSRRFHVALEMAAGMVLVFVAAVLVGRFRLHGSLKTLVKFAAMLVLALENLISAGITITHDTAETGFAAWAFALAGLLGAGLLVVAALLRDRTIRNRDRALLVTIGAGAAVLTPVILLPALFIDALPGPTQTPPETTEQLVGLAEPVALSVTEGLTGLCYVVAAIAFARQADARDDEFLRWLSVALVIAGCSYLNYALFPSQFTELLYSGDLFFLAATAALGYAAVREIANEEAARIRTAVLDERRRVARDLHDGVAQELAFIAAQTRWSIHQPTAPQPLEQIMDAVERALDESRGAIAALNRPVDEPLEVALGHAAQDVADRVGARLQLDLEPGLEVSPDWREALLRIAREAVGNAVRHGHARTVRLQLREGDGIWLRVSDDGDGFDPGEPRSGQSYGLTSMRERTQSLGGEFAISSVPGAGTTIEVTLP